MKNRQLALLLAALATASAVSRATTLYNNDYLVGFTAQTGSDLIYDLGDPSTVTNGQTWNLSSVLSSFDLSTVHWGIVGDNTATPDVVYVTKLAGAAAPPNVPNQTTWNRIDASLASMYQIFPAAGPGQYITPASTGQNSWNQQTIVGTLTTQFHNAYINPNVVGQSTATVYVVGANNTAPQAVGNFSLGANGVLTFSTGSSPTPAKLSITRAGNVSSISFVGASGVAYTLLGTNSLASGPVSSWPVLGTNSGTGTLVFKDTNSSPVQFYRVKEQ
jgi:hypothetical protein